MSGNKEARLFGIVEDFTYTLKSFDIVNRVVRPQFARHLFTLLESGPEELEVIREEEIAAWRSCNGF